MYKLCIISEAKFGAVLLENFNCLMYAWVRKELKSTCGSKEFLFHNYLLCPASSTPEVAVSCVIQVTSSTSDLTSCQPLYARSATSLSSRFCQLFCFCLMCCSCVTHILFAIHSLALHAEWAGWSGAPLLCLLGKVQASTVQLWACLPCWNSVGLLHF